MFAAGAAAFALASGSAAFTLASAAGAEFVFEFAVDAGASAGVSGFAERTETLPLNAGIDMSNAEIINTTAAAIVILERIVVVPRGVNAELEILLVKSAPASVLPGCRSTAPTSTTHEMKNKV